MSPEHHFSPENTRLLGYRKVEVNIHGQNIILKENVAPRGAKKHPFPMGTISSIRPVLRGVLGAASEEEGYWSQIDSLATMDPQTAANKLKHAGFGQKRVAELLVKTDPVVNERIAWGELKGDQIEAMIDEVSSAIEYLFKSPFHGRRKGK